MLQAERQQARSRQYLVDWMNDFGAHEVSPSAVSLQLGHSKPIQGLCQGLILRRDRLNGTNVAQDWQGDYVLPNFSCNAGNNRSGLNGTEVKRIPVASANALPIAAATGL